jgi:hypothetical protein
MNYPSFITDKLAQLDAPTRARCLAWLEALPAGAELKQVKSEVYPQQTLAGTRVKIARHLGMIAQLSRRPQPADDIEQRVRRYVAQLGESVRPEVHGTAERETLLVDWPVTWAINTLAALIPGQLAAYLTAQIRQDAAAPLSPAEDRQLEKLQIARRQGERRARPRRATVRRPGSCFFY